MGKTMEMKEVLRTRGLEYMGYGQLAQYAMRDTDLPLTAKAIYAFLCSLAGSGSTTFPSRDTVVSRLKIGKDAYYKYRKMLVDQGYISVEQQINEAGQFCRTDFIIEDKPKKFAEDKRYQDDTTRIYGVITFTGIKAAGYGNICRAVMYDERLSVKAKGLYAYFISYAGAGNQAAPSQKTILHHLGISLDSYYKYLAELTSLNYIIVTQRHENGRLGVNDYCIVSHPDEEKAVLQTRTSKKRVISLGAAGKSSCGREEPIQVPEIPDTDESIAAQETHQVPKNPDTVEPVAAQGVHQVPKIQDTVKENTVLQDAAKQDTAKEVTENTDHSNIHSTSNITSSKTSFFNYQSVYPSADGQSDQTHWIDMMDRRDIKNYILEEIGFFLTPNPAITPQNSSTILMLVDLVTATITRKSPTIRIGKEEKPRCEVIDKLLLLTVDHYDFVIGNVKKQAGHIRNVPAYYLTALYNSIETIDLCIDRQITEDFDDLNTGGVS